MKLALDTGHSTREYRYTLQYKPLPPPKKGFCQRTHGKTANKIPTAEQILSPYVRFKMEITGKVGGYLKPFQYFYIFCNGLH